MLCQQKVNFLKTEDKSLIKFWKKNAGRILKEEEVQIDNRKQTTSIEDNWTDKARHTNHKLIQISESL